MKQRLGCPLDLPGHLSFLTLQRGNAFHDALRRKEDAERK
ncbi:DUF1534 domain-containing protein [Pseudomonas syringae]|uniref:DUF1534 domain-containing protein n=1 Tax=Pseudomonas syringae TaxID=317 RepID=A0A9Q4FGN9_PSESX|nr:DUF1534 domain-containing protein [Pseudomonas syringae]MCF5472971.1 DUF1534 domain-containing protein [Pseudomonas syringae]MCF5482986.1 DUF1534 domain-containing protein [Pseudomonas syringae]MCF5487407.1 DUF1534 domain-containing protein [Pseudomonas syringae]MCF5491372.1 DUF1534 domain-containing protein [Pseudomonas syringae]